MVLIAIDKHSRKILGYLCKNDQTVAYCCSECDVEFTTASDLEEHMIAHEQKSNDEIIQRSPHVEADKLHETQCVEPEGKLEEKSEEASEEIPQEKLQETPTEVEKPAEKEIPVEKEPPTEKEIPIEKEPPAEKEIPIEKEPPKEEAAPKDIPTEKETPKEEETPPRQLSSIEHENLLKIKYQVIPCTVRLHRDKSIDSNRFNLSNSPDFAGAGSGRESTSSEVHEMESISKSTEKNKPQTEPSTSRPPSKLSDDDIPLQQLKRKRVPPKKPADPIPSDEIISQKRRKTPTPKTGAVTSKKPMKPKPPQKSVCFLCGAQFATSIQLTQHQKTHFASSVSHSPVFPCNICGRKVKNLKIHLRLHKKDGKQQPRPQQQPQPQQTEPQTQPQQQRPTSANGKVVKRPAKRSKSNESQKSNTSTKSEQPTKGPSAKLAESHSEATTADVFATSSVCELTPVMPSDTLTYVKLATQLAEASSSTDAVFSSIPCESYEEEAELISSNEVLTAISNDSNASSYNLIDDCMTDTDALLLFADRIMLPPPPMPPASSSCVAIIDPLFVPSDIDPLNIMDEDPLSFVDLEPLSVNEPSQSTSTIQSIDYPKQTPQYNTENTFQPNGLNAGKRKYRQKSQFAGDAQEHEQPQTAAANQAMVKCSKCSRHFATPALMQKHCEKHDKKANCKYCGKLLAQSYVYFHVSKYHKDRSGGGNIPLATVDEGEGEEVEKEEVEAATLATTEKTNETVVEQQEAAALVASDAI